jgi:hypothetical protein
LPLEALVTTLAGYTRKRKKENDMSKHAGMHKGGGTKTRGRARGVTSSPLIQGNQGALAREKKLDTNNPIGRGGGKNRGDRRDTNRAFTNNSRRQPNFGDPLGSGRKQIQGGGKAVKGGGKREKGTYDH